MSSKEIRFTKAALTNIKPPRKPKEAKGGVYDTYKDTHPDGNGLILLVSHGGAKSFYLYRKFRGKPERFKLGSFPDTSVEQARKKLRELRAQMDSGKNPKIERARLKDETSFGELFEQKYLPHAKQNKKSWKQDEDNYRQKLKGFKNKALSAIGRQDVRALHQKITANSGPYVANRVLALISTVYGFAQKHENWIGENPAKGVDKNKEVSRDRFLTGEELARFFEAVHEEPNEIARNYILISLLCGQRRSNVLAMRWDEIDFRNEFWRIPETKSGGSQMVSLTTPALALLNEMKQSAVAGVPWVFPSLTSASGHMEEPKSAWKRILKRAEIENLRIHDLRRTYGSYMAMNGASQYMIGAALGHKSDGATRVYARLSNDPVRQAQEQAAQRMLELMGGAGK